MKTPKQLRRDIQNLSEHLSQVQMAAHHPASRRVRTAEIDVFVQPGHVLASAQKVVHE